MRKIIFIGLGILFHTFLYSQDSIPQHIKEKIFYPAIELHPFMGVIKNDYSALKYDPKLEYKVALDVYDKVSDSTKMNTALVQVARIYNLNIANGVPKDKLKVAAVIHWLAVNAILNNEAYEHKYGVENPNIELIRTLKELGVNFYVCSQNLGFMDIPNNNLAKEIEVAISAKTAFIHLDQLGYYYLDISEH